ncbi:hypothetical protein RND81_12G210700 [Saponaria officinalis]|uniref:Uncharacterized protein n=1 Tax=Saponaria officinalis TaxID=3572 RepID=A0AAW1HDG5_SAPOF
MALISEEHDSNQLHHYSRTILNHDIWFPNLLPPANYEFENFIHQLLPAIECDGKDGNVFFTRYENRDSLKHDGLFEAQAIGDAIFYLYALKKTRSPGTLPAEIDDLRQWLAHDSPYVKSTA